MDSRKTDVELRDECQKQLAELLRLRNDLCTAMRGMARELLEHGNSPSAELIEQLAKYRFDFEQLRAAIFQRESSSHGDCSLNALQEEMESQTVIQATLKRLDCFALIQHVDQTDFAPWQRCRADGTKLREKLLSIPATQARQTAEQFLSPQMPLNAIVTLVADGAKLSDERWSMLLDSVSDAYGREVSTAIARGKLTLTPGTWA